MPIDLHYICKRGENWKRIGDDLFETGNWTAANDVADLAIGGRIYLHQAQKELAWHGGTILEWRSAPEPTQKKKIFIFRREFEYKQRCMAIWAQESAVAYWNNDRSRLLKKIDYIDTLKTSGDV